MKPARNARQFHSRPQALIWLPTADAIEAGDRCMNLVREQRYRFVGTVVNDWAAVRKMFIEGEADILVGDRREDLPDGFLPRLEFVAEQPVIRSNGRLYRRTRIIRPGAAE